MRDFKLYVFIASLLLVVYLVAEYKRPKPIDWTPTYLKTDKIPLGTYVLYNSLNDIFPGANVQTFREPVYNVLTDHHITSATYIIICNNIKLTQSDAVKLFAFIKRGNDVFISSKHFGDYLYQKLNVDTRQVYTKDVEDSIHFVNAQLDTTKLYHINKEIRATHFDEIDSVKAISLALNMAHKSTYVKYNFGKGALYLNSTPELFSNFSILEPASAGYAAKALSYLKNNKTILWDEYYSRGREGELSVMRVFFKNPSLKWAYYIALISLIVYVFYQMKRRQRIIPIIEPLANTTLDFVNVIGQVYYEQRDNSNIAQKKASYFLEYLRTKYNLKTTILNDEFVTALAHKSGVNEPFVRTLLNQVTAARSGAKVTDTELIDLNKNIEQFYIQSR